METDRTEIPVDVTGYPGNPDSAELSDCTRELAACNLPTKSGPGAQKFVKPQPSH
jgi:hypothetical protein